MLPKKISAFGIELKFLEKSDLPLLLLWRNQPSIRPFLDDPREISLPMLSFWYEKILRYKTCLPWLAYYNNTAVAYTEIKDMDPVNKSCAGGLFLFGEKYYGAGLSYRIVLCREIVMRALGLDTLYSHVCKDNGRSMDFCRQYGGELVGMKDGYNIFRYERDKREARLKFIAKAIRQDGDFEKFIERSAL